ncbi:MAG TPA: hypothetical protein VF784_11300 [Anaerolineales bacterium]
MIGWVGRFSRLASYVAAGAVPAAAQCSMCRTALAAHSGEVFNRAILILLLPAMAFFSGTFLLFHRLRQSGDDDQQETRSESRESPDGEKAGEE